MNEISRIQEGYSLLPKAADAKNGFQLLLEEIRPIWKGRNLIHRVEKLLPIDASSACQRLFNAAIHDLKEKIIVMGVGLAKEVANIYRLPQLNSDDDIINYNVSKTIDLAYRIGLLTKSEYSRMHRCYQIRRDLEHEDNEYEAVIEDIFYIFKSVIDIVLSKDPIEIIKVTDAKQVIEISTNIVVSEEFLLNYASAPQLRQKEITELLVSYAFDGGKPDVVRQNSVELLRHIYPSTAATVTIDVAGQIEKKLGNNKIDLKTAKISNACGAIAYFKKVRLKEFYSSIQTELVSAYDWDEQAAIVAKLEDIGGLSNCPTKLYLGVLKRLVEFYLGERSFGQWSSYRPLFFSNAAAPIIKRIVESDGKRVGKYLDDLKEDRNIKTLLENSSMNSRFEELSLLRKV